MIRKTQTGLIATQLWIDERFSFTRKEMNQVLSEMKALKGESPDERA